EGAEDDLAAGGDGVRAIDDLERRDADGTPGTMDELDAGGQDLVDAVLHDAVRLAPAHFHQHPRPRCRAGDCLEPAARRGAVPMLVEEFHVDSSPSCSSSRKSSNTRCGPAS